VVATDPRTILLSGHPAELLATAQDSGAWKARFDSRLAARELRRKLRVGIFAEATRQPSWVAKAFSIVAESDVAEITVVVTGTSDSRAAPWHWRAYVRVDRSIFRATSTQHADLIAVLPNVRNITIPTREAWGDAAHFWRADVQRLQLDVAFALGEIDDAVLEGLARHGVWRYCFGSQLHSIEPLAGVREAVNGETVTTAALKVRFASQDERLLFQSYTCTCPFSVSRNRDNVFSKSEQFPIRALSRLHERGVEWLRECPEATDAARTPSVDIESSIYAISRIGARLGRRALQNVLTVEQWFIAFRFEAPGKFCTDLSRFRRLIPPRDRLWADPFALERDGRYFIFFEELIFAEKKGHISMMEIARDGTCSSPIRVLERDYHLSYPFLTEFGGKLYMVPETFQNRTVEIYRCVDFPSQWRRERVLVDDAPCADATLHHADDRWWMFVNIGAGGAKPDEELHLFFADELLGEWRPHRENPVKSDVRSSRPAGRLYTHHGHVYRPAQIGAPLYGAGISVNQVLELTPYAYREREVDRIVPWPGTLGVHTLNSAGKLTVLDGFIRRPRLWGTSAGSGVTTLEQMPYSP
jgi:hypothetical protein